MTKLGVITDGISRDFEHALKALVAAGLEYAELQFVWDKEVGDLSGAEIAKVKQLMDVHGVRASSVSRYLFGRLSVLDTAVGDPAHQREMEALKRCIATAQTIGAPLVRVQSFRKEMILFGGGGFEAWIPTLHAWDKLVALLAPAVALAESEGITLVVETANSGMVNSAYLARKLVDAHQSPHLRVLWDPGNGLYCNESAVPEGLESLAGGYIGHVHVKDQRVSIRAATIESCRLGDGQMAPMLKPLAEGLKREGYEGVISFESVYRPEGGLFEDGFRASVGLFKELFG
jgi:sugar phosphate isomerase/epimerase